MYYVILVKARSYWVFDSGTHDKSEANRLYHGAVADYGKDRVYKCQSDSAEKKDVEKIIHAKNSMLVL